MLQTTFRTLFQILYYGIAITGWILNAFLYAFLVASTASLVIGGSIALHLGLTGDWSLLPLPAGSAILTAALWGLRKSLETITTKAHPHTARLGEWVSNL